MDAFSLQHAILPHSCFPSCAVNHRNELVMLRPLLPGDRLTLDYSCLFTGKNGFFDCSCGCNGCRKKILGFDFLPVNFQEYYLEYDAVPGHVLKTLQKIPDYKIYHFPKLISQGFYWLS